MRFTNMSIVCMFYFLLSFFKPFAWFQNTAAAKFAVRMHNSPNDALQVHGYHVMVLHMVCRYVMSLGIKPSCHYVPAPP